MRRLQRLGGVELEREADCQRYPRRSVLPNPVLPANLAPQTTPGVPQHLKFNQWGGSVTVRFLFVCQNMEVLHRPELPSSSSFPGLLRNRS